MSHGPALNILRKRALFLQKVREFFVKRNVLEVDCCALSPRAGIDSNIDSMETSASEFEMGYLHTSPEYAMKRLLASGLGDIYFLGHVFRKSDIGRFHNPEFTMVEWYRLGISFAALIQETCELLSLFLENLPTRTLSYGQAFQQYTHLHPKLSSVAELQLASSQLGAHNPNAWDRSTCIDFLLSHGIEPHLGINELTILTDYPPEEAALAQVVEKNGDLVAERFEIYHQGIELANGYHELGDAEELKKRFEEENALRRARNKQAYLLDEHFFAALKQGLPESCGVSVGFDRAFMLHCQAESIEQVLAFPWPRKPLAN